LAAGQPFCQRLPISFDRVIYFDPGWLMRIGYLVPEFPNQTHIMFWREIVALRQSGEDIVLLSTRRPPAAACRHEFAAQAAAETHYLFPPKAGEMAAWTATGLSGLSGGLSYLSKIRGASLGETTRQYLLLASAIRLVRVAQRNGIDHIHAHSIANSAHVLAMARRMGGPKYSLTAHGDLNVYGTHHQEKMELAEFVFVVGSHLRRQTLEQTTVDERRVIVTCMGVDTSRFARLGREREFRPGSLKLATVARLHPTKGHLHALNAIKTAVDAGLDVTYAIAGEGSNREAIEARVRELGLERRVTLMGSLGEAEVCELLSRSDALMLASYGAGEAWPVCIMEAMAAGLPVISSVIGATPEMITPGVDGLLTAQHDEDALFRGVADLANDVALRRRLSEAGRVTAQKRFDVGITAGALRDAIHGRLPSTSGSAAPAASRNVATTPASRRERVPKPASTAS
jgi:glycosyltransferase involved in cell wall biosynthesis